MNEQVVGDLGREMATGYVQVYEFFDGFCACALNIEVFVRLRASSEVSVCSLYVYAMAYTYSMVRATVLADHYGQRARGNAS